ncbi:MAG TPA: beta-ketoacyl-ACP synthase II [Candidatus Limnocylindria bacterium]|nr:beta-ketoacyl-ACP synthase II [Candidatus Limnocylindria bacterium]
MPATSDVTPASARVVVTGMGAITPVGNDVETMWRNLQAGTSVAHHIDRFDSSRFRTRFAAEVVDFDPNDWMDPKDARRADRVIQLAMATSTQALAQAGLKPEGDLADEVGVLIGTGIGGLTTLDEAARVMREEGPDRVSPLTAVNMLPDMASGQVAIQFGLTGVNFCVISACATGTNAVGEAAEIIKRGDALAMVVGGTESTVTPLALAAFHRTGSLSTRNDDPAHASRPFDKERDGFVVGEGAGGLVLERLDFALDRGATPLAEIVGYGNSADAFHVSAPEPEGKGAARSMSRAMAKAGIGPADIDYINAHGTSTQLNDRSETMAIKRALGEDAYRIPVSSTKSMTGHMLGAAGVVEAVVCVQVIRDGVIPPTINYEFPDPDCDLDYVPNVARQATVRTAMSNSFGFGGHNATVILRAYE